MVFARPHKVRLRDRDKAGVELVGRSGPARSVLPEKIDPVSGDGDHLVERPLPVPEMGTEKVVPKRLARIGTNFEAETQETLGVERIVLSSSGRTVVLVGGNAPGAAEGPEKPGNKPEGREGLRGDPDADPDPPGGL